MRGVKYQILGLGIILLGMTVPSVSTYRIYAEPWDSGWR